MADISKRRFKSQQELPSGKLNSVRLSFIANFPEGLRLVLKWDTDQADRADKTFKNPLDPYHPCPINQNSVVRVSQSKKTRGTL
jgi:hypothetical protein